MAGDKEYRVTAEPEEDEYLQYFDWDRFEAEQGDEAEAAEQGGEE